MSTDNITVAIKARPQIQREKNSNLGPSWLVKGQTIIQIDCNGQNYGEPYTFGKFFKIKQ